MATPAYTGNFWAKSDRGDPQRIHLLEHHLADVGAWPAAAGATTWTRQLSPFDPSLEIDKLAMPANWLKGEEVPETLETAANEGGFDFRARDRKFRYDRHGLRRV